MIDRNSKNISYGAQFGIFLGLAGAGLIIGNLISAGVWLIMTGRSLLNLEADIVKPEYFKAAMTIQTITTLFLFFIPVYIFALICYRKPAKFIGFNTNVNYKQILLLLGIFVFTFPLSGALAELNKILPISNYWAAKFKAMELTRATQEAAFINLKSFPRYVFSLIMIGLLPGLFEEIAFRSGLQNIFIRWFKGPWLAIILTSVIFSLVHISYYGFLVRFGLGVILGLLFYYSGSIWLSVLFHFLYNGFQVTLLYIFTISGSKNQKDIEESFPIWVGVIALGFIIYFFIQFRKISISQKAKIPEEDLPDDDFHTWATAQP